MLVTHRSVGQMDGKLAMKHVFTKAVDDMFGQWQQHKLYNDTCKWQ